MTKNEYKKYWAKQHPESRRLSTQKYRLSHKEKINAYDKEYRRTHKLSEYLRKRRWLLNNRGKAIATKKLWKSRNKEKVREELRRYHQEHPHYHQAAGHNYRARRRKAGALSKKDVQRVYEDNIKKYGTLTCYLCEEEVSFGEDSIDHKMPLFRGGSNLYENLAIAHKKCNSVKGAKTPMEYWIGQI